MNTARTFVWAILLTACLVVNFTVQAFAHDWYTLLCCNDRDCGPARVLRMNKDGSRLVQRKMDGAIVTIPADQPIKLSQDGDLHICLYGVNGTWIVRCVFEGGTS